MKARLLTCIICLFATQWLYSQSMHDFTVTDVSSQQHKLYEDYLNKNKVVVIKFFFTTCPPCISNAPLFQQKYIDYGEGTQDVEFFSFTTIPADYDPQVIAFESQYKQTMKGISVDGGALSLSYEFKDGTYGSWYGTPSFTVIAPDRSIQYPVFFNELDNAIATARSKKSQLSTTFNLSPTYRSSTNPNNNQIRFYLKPKNSDTPKIEITKNNQGTYSFNYPTLLYPQMQEPQVIMESIDTAYSDDITVLDIVYIQRHILRLDPFTKPYQLAAADVNGDKRISAADLTVLRKVILGTLYSFPNNVPSFKLIPDAVDIQEKPGKIVNLQVEIIKMGDIN